MNKKRFKAFLTVFLLLLSCVSCFFSVKAESQKPEIVLRVCNWEEYIDVGEWDESEVIDLESGDIFGENPLIEDFEAWYEEVYGKKVRVEYSTFGTCEDLYNMLTLGDVYDIACPSEYMIMKLVEEGFCLKFSDGFFDESNVYNYYIKGVSPYIRNIFTSHEILDATWEQYAAGFMWGITGFVYNPEIVDEEDVSTWKLLENTKYKRQITIKDNVRDSFFAAVGAVKSEYLLSENFKQSPDYLMKLQAEMNDVSLENIQKVQDYLQKVKDNLYSFETDSGKADMITGKVVANYQWSGDAVYTMDQAEEDGYYLNFAVPKESTDVYFDGWILLKSGIRENDDKQHAAESFINFLSRPDNAIRNMYYIGYTSVIGGGEDGRIFEYLEWNYGAGEDEEDTVEYPVGHLFTDNEDEYENYVLTVPKSQLKRQLATQYPSEEVLKRGVIMEYFDMEKSEVINQMWTRVRCYNIKNVPVYAWVLTGVVITFILILFIRKKTKKY